MPGLAAPLGFIQGQLRTNHLNLDLEHTRPNAQACSIRRFDILLWSKRDRYPFLERTSVRA
jgi:hypothetical protein